MRVRGAQLRSHVWLHALLRGRISKTKGDIYTADEAAEPPAAHLNRLVEGTIFGTSNIIFHSARDRKSVLISVCETHLQFMRETVHAEGKHTRAKHSHPYTHVRGCTPAEKTHTAVFVSVDKTVLRDCERRRRGGEEKEREREREREMNSEIRERERWREAEG